MAEAAAISAQPPQSGAREAGAIALGSGVGGGSSRNATSFRAVPDFLAVIIDLNPYIWAELERKAQGQTSGGSKGKAKSQAKNGHLDAGVHTVLKKALDEIRLFLNAHTAMQHGNGLAVYAGGVGTARLLYTTSQLAPATLSRRPNEVVDANTYPAFKHLDDQIFAGVHAMMQEMSELDEDRTREPIGIVSAMAQALCHVNRLTASNNPDVGSGTGGVTIPSARSGAADQTAGLGGFRTRLLVLSVTEDASAQYIPIMNSIFAAQKQRVVIDVCKLHGEDTVFLQQASHLTSGVYFRLNSLEELLQTLMTTFLPSRSIRHLLNLPTEESVDFRAACFCHRRVVDIGYICSVCLSIFCEPPDRCNTCKSKFPRDTLQRYRTELRTLPSTAAEDTPMNE